MTEAPNTTSITQGYRKGVPQVSSSTPPGYYREKIKLLEANLAARDAEIAELEAALNIVSARHAAIMEDIDDPPTKEYLVRWARDKAKKTIQKNQIDLLNVV